jgi:glutathione S-transferase
MKGRALTGPHDYDQIPKLADRGKLRVQRFLEEIDQTIGNKLYVAGDRFSVADIDLLVLIDFSAWRKLSLPEGAMNARRWYETVRARPSAQL